jgi:hypothetical protein
MIKIDEKFLEEVGLSSMSDEQKRSFIAQTQEELENRVGEKMSEGMTIEQLREFDGIMNKDRNTMLNVLARFEDFRNDEIYLKLLERHGVTEGNIDILGEYLSVKWIQTNRPDYAEIANSVANELKAEIASSRDQILAVA